MKLLHAVRLLLWTIVCFVDAHVQYVFDVCFFALMRQGYSKAEIRRGIITIYVASIVAPYVRVYSVVQSVSEMLAVTAAIMPHTVPFILYWGWRLHVEERWDREAEHAGTMSKSDTLGAFTKGCALGYFYVVASMDPPSAFDEACFVLGGVMVLAAGYLCGTPPRPPPKKEPAAAALRAEAA